jgi:bifunctional DNase/RNase
MIDSIVGNLSLSKNGFILLLRPRQPGLSRMLPILIGVAEAQSIALALARKRTPRPMTHDLMKGLLDTFGATLVRVEIVRFEGKTYYAQLLLNRGEETLEAVDARPSDAVALALRCNAPIWVAEEVYKKGGVEVPSEAGSAPALPHPVPDPRKQLEEEMKKAIQEERYEDAARIRDQLKQWDSH